MNDSISMSMVSQMFESLTGEKADKKAALLQRSAAETVMGWLKQDVSINDNQVLLCTTIAHLAFYRYCLAQAAINCDKFRAGDVTIEQKPTLKAEVAERLYKESLDAIRHLLRPKRFCFKRV